MTSAHPPARDDDGDYVTVARRLDPIAAELLRGRLAADGIPALLADAHLVQTYSLWAAALGGVRVMVPASWVPQALRAIAAVEHGDLALDDAALAGDDAGAESRAADGAHLADPGGDDRAHVHGAHLAAAAAALLLLLALMSALGAETSGDVHQKLVEGP
jgi:hypothetical protein